MTSSQSLSRLQTQLEPVAGSCALHEAEEILECLLNCSRHDLYRNGSREIQDAIVDQTDSVIARRLTHEPLPYILGRAYFYDRFFTVTPAVLIPRAETEVLIERILVDEGAQPRHFLDVGTGSGAILATLLEQRPSWRGVGIDLSREALRVARINVSPSVPLLRADMIGAIKPCAGFDFLVSNPPYVSDAEMAELDPSVRDFEPEAALRGGSDGLDSYRTLSRQTATTLKPGGRIYCEIGALQKDGVTGIFAAAGWREIDVFPDLANRPRVVRAVRGCSPTSEL